MRGNNSQGYKPPMRTPLSYADQRASIGRKPSISKINYTLPEISIELDSILYSRIDQIKEIALKRKLLLDITDSSMLNETLVMDQSVQIASIPNHLVGQYIKSVYAKYKIKDPFYEGGGWNQKMPRTENQTALSSPAGDFQRKSGANKSNTIKKLMKMKEIYRRQFQEESIRTPQKQQERRETIKKSEQTPIKIVFEPNNPRWKQIGYKTNEKIKFKSHTIQETSKKQNISIFNKPVIHNQKPILQVFRYCPMCEDAILESNISFHEKSCFYLKQAYKMSVDQIFEVICDKIKRLKSQLSEEYTKKTEKQMLQDAYRLKQNMLKWLKKVDNQEFQRTSYQNVQKSYSEIALNSAQKASKLNWFLKIKRNIQREIAVSRNFQR